MKSWEPNADEGPMGHYRTMWTIWNSEKECGENIVASQRCC